LETAAQDGAPLTGKRYVVAAEHARDVNLGALEMRDACLVLSGPVRLMLGAGSRLAHVTVLLGPAKPAERDAGVDPSDAGVDPSDAGVDAGTPDSGPEPVGEISPASVGAEPNLYLGYAELERVALRAYDASRPSGSVRIEFSTCLQCESRIDSLTVTESNMQNSRLTAGTLNLVGGAFDAIELAFDYGLLAGSIANDLRTTACHTLSLVGATVTGRASQIGPCDCASQSALDARDDPPDAGASDPEATDAGAPRDAGQPDAACTGATISQTKLIAGMLDGKVHAENSSFYSVLFARHARTFLDLWNVEIGLSVVCGKPIDIRLDKHSEIGCTSCDQQKASTACMLDHPPALTVNPCPSLKGKLRACEPPLPMRRNPFIPTPPRLRQ
jgi:hypothetical protein